MKIKSGWHSKWTWKHKWDFKSSGWWGGHSGQTEQREQGQGNRNDWYSIGKCKKSKSGLFQGKSLESTEEEYE